jgi:tetratricopeptide (TPR) repeat protein
MAMVAIFIGAISSLTWVKGVNPVRASMAEGRALKHFRAGEMESAVLQLDRAIKLAPDVPIYYNNRAEMFLLYQIRPDEFTEPVCDRQTQVPYLICLGFKSLEFNLESAERQPFNYRSQMATANSAFKLQLSETAVEYYDKATKLVPNGWRVRFDLAESLINLGSYEQAVRELDRVLDILGGTRDSGLPSVLKGRALWAMGQPDEAIESLKFGISVGGNLKGNLDVIGEINEALGYELDTQHFTQLLDQNPQDPAAHVFRGRAYFLRGEYVDALKDIEVGISMGLETPELLAERGYLRLKTGNPVEAHSDLFRAIDSSPQNALYNAHIGAFQLDQGEFALALDSLENAITLDPDLGLAYLIRSQVYTALKLKGTAKEFFDIPKELDLPTSQDYAERGVIFAFLGEYPLALSDVDEAIKINPDQADYYNVRAKIYAVAGDFPSALADFDTAIQLNPEAGQYLLNRGVLFDILGSTDRSLADFKTAQSMGGIDLPEPVGRSLAYFATYTNDPSIDEKLEDFRRLNRKRNKLLDTDNLHAGPVTRTYRVTLQSLGQASLALFRWNDAIEALSELIELSPDEPEAYKHRGDAYLGLRNYSEATIDYSRAVGLDPANSAFLTARGKAYAESGQIALARNDLDQALRIDPKSSDAHNLLGFLSVQSKDYSQAFADLDRALEISLLNHQAHFIQATAYTGLGQIPAALEAIGQSINLAPNNPEYFYVRGLLRAELGDHELAINDFEQAIALWAEFKDVDPKLTRPFFSRGQAHLELGNQNQALFNAVRTMQFLTDNFNTPEWNGYLPKISSQLADARQLISDSFARVPCGFQEPNDPITSLCVQALKYLQ